MPVKPTCRIGDTFMNNYGEVVEVVKYTSVRDVTVRFPQGIELSKFLCALRSGGFNSPLTRTFSGVGYLGEGVFNTVTDRRASRLWNWMISRCYNKNAQVDNPAYAGCTVADEWHNFQNYAKWYYQNRGPEGWQIDKDLRVKGNKIYAPDFCSFVPKVINQITCSSRAKRGDCPVGVSYNKDKGLFTASCGKDSVVEYLGAFSTPVEAFLSYKTAKEVYIKSLAEKYRGQIHQDVYRTLANYNINITD